MRTLFAAVFLLSASTVALCQEIHSPSEIMEIMEKSEVSYEISALDAESFDEATSDSDPVLTSHLFHIVNTPDGADLQMYELPHELMELKETAEEHYQRKDYQKARESYSQLLEQVPGFVPIITYMAQCYLNEDNLEQASIWCRRALDSNYHDYMAHAVMASVHARQQRVDSAVFEATLAHVLNIRAGFKNQMINAFEAAGYTFDDWTFVPRYALMPKDASTMSIEIDMQQREWMFYAFCKALWAYEPGYSETMTEGEDGAAQMLQERECLSLLARSYLALRDKETVQVNPAIEGLLKAIKLGHRDAFIIYELFLQDNPRLVYGLNRTIIDLLATYVMQVHAER